MKHSLNAFTEFFKIVFFFILGMLMPKRGKRIILLTGVYAKLVEKGLFHDDAMRRLNRALMLADSEEALNLPPSIYRKVLDDQQVEEAIKQLELSSSGGELCLSDTEIKRVSKQLAGLTPMWLRYADDKAIEKDLVSLLYCQ